MLIEFEFGIGNCVEKEFLIEHRSIRKSELCLRSSRSRKFCARMEKSALVVEDCEVFETEEQFDIA